MLQVAPVRESIRNEMPDDYADKFGIEKLNYARSSVPAITHVDFSARSDRRRHPQSTALWPAGEVP